MERLRYVARAGGGDPAVIVAETVEAIRGLAPGPRQLVSVCRNLVDRNITCGPLWWLCARLLSEPDALARGCDLAGEIADDPTSDRLAVALPEEATVMSIGFPPIAARALARRGDITVLAVEAGYTTSALIRLLDRFDVRSESVAAEATLAAVTRADVVVIEAEACTAGTAICAMGAGLASVAATNAATPVWMVAGRGRRLPVAFVQAIARRVTCGDRPWEAQFELVATELVTRVAGPGGVAMTSTSTLAAECPPVPELVPPASTV